MQLVTVRSALEKLGEQSAVLLTSPTTGETQIHGVAVNDPALSQRRLEGTLLLLPGVDPHSEQAGGILEAATAAGCRALAVRSQGAAPADLVSRAEDLGVALVGVADEVDWFRFGSAVASILDGALAARERAQSGADLHDLANALAASIGGAVSIEDLGRHVLAHSTLADQPIDSFRRDAILGRRAGDAPANDPQYATVHRHHGAVRITAATPGGLARLAMAVRAGKEPVGTIWVVDADQSLDPRAAELLEDAAPLAALQILRARSAADLARQHRADLVRGMVLDETNATSAVARLVLVGAEWSAVAVASRTDPDREVHRLLVPLESQLGVRIGKVAACAIGSVCCVVLAPSTVTDRAGITQTVTDAVTRVGSSLALPLVAAIGRSHRDPGGLPGSYDDASRALDLLLAGSSQDSVVHAVDVAATLVLNRAAPPLLADPLLTATPSGNALATTHAEVLRTWLDHGRDFRRTAAALNVHHNTVRYRLRQVVEELGLDLNDPDQMLLTWYALRQRH